MVGWLYELEPMSLKVLGSPNHAVGVVVVSVTRVVLIHLEVAHFCTVGADSPWKELRRSCYELKSRKWRFKSKNSSSKGPCTSPNLHNCLGNHYLCITVEK